MHLTNDDYTYSLPVQYPAYTRGYNPAIYDGDSYYSRDGVSWSDMKTWRSDNTTACIKGYVSYSSVIPPVANFSANATSGNVPLCVQFTDTSTGNPSSWLWHFGDGANATVQNPVHCYSSPGLYSVNLTVANAGGSDIIEVSDYINATLPVPLPPVASFTSNVTSGDIPLYVQFIDTSTGNPTLWNWDFGDLWTSYLQNPEHEYSVPGHYTVNLTVSNAGGSNLTSVPNYITATMPKGPLARFSSNVTSGFIPLCIQFTDQSVGNPSSWYWTFGDGKNSTVQNPVHTYYSPGNYTVNLSVANAAGSNLTWNPDYIHATTPLPSPYISDIYPDSGQVGTNVTFTLTGNNFVSGAQVNLTRSGVSTITTQGSLSGSNLTGVFTLGSGTQTGVYNVSVNQGGQLSNDNVLFTVMGGPITPPVADFSATPRVGITPLSVQFTDTSTGTPTSWNWNFGDGQNNSVQHPSHTYVNGGSYTVSLQVSNAGGSDVKTVPDYINVTDPIPVPPVAGFTSNVTSGLVPLCVQFTDTSTGNPTSWNWLFGDGGNSTIQNPVHLYSGAGLYSVHLTVSNSAGSDTKSAENYINGTTPTPTPSVPSAVVENVTVESGKHTKGNFTLKNLDNGLSICHVNITIGNDSIGEFEVGDISFYDEFNNTSGYISYPYYTELYAFATPNLTGAIDEIPVAQFTYNGISPGSTFVNVTVNEIYDGNGAIIPNVQESPGVLTVLASPTPVPPVANFTSNVTSGSVPLSVQFTDTSTGNPTSWSWLFGDGGSSNLQNPVYTYSSAGLYTVNLTVSNSAGSDTKVSVDYMNVTSPVLTYSITASAGPGGSISPSGLVSVPSGSSQVFTIVPDSGYLIEEVLVDGRSVGAIPAYTFADVRSDHSIHASFIKPVGQYEINASADNWSIVYPSGISTYPEGSEKTYLTQAKPGADLRDVQVDTQSKGPVDSWTFTNISSDHTVVTDGEPTPDQVHVFFDVSSRTGSAPLTVQFMDRSIGNPTSWYWQFGDGTVSTDQHSTHTYLIPGSYTVSLRANNDKTGGYGVWNNGILVV